MNNCGKISTFGNEAGFSLYGDKTVGTDLTYEEFVSKLKRAVGEKMGEGARVIVSSTEKINCPHQKSMVVKWPGKNTSVAISLEACYEEFQSGASLDDIAGQAATLYKRQDASGNTDLSFYSDYQRVRDMLVCRLVNYEINQRLLEDVPHIRFFDLAIVYYCELDWADFQSSGILVRNSHLSLWKITPEQLHAAALKNTRARHPVQFLSLPQLMEKMSKCGVLLPEMETQLTPEAGTDSEIVPIPEFQPASEKAPLYILSNENQCFGAICICFPDVWRAVSGQIGGDFYALPSSLHECIILPESICKEGEEGRLHEMVKEINENAVLPEEVLGDSVYRYYAKEQELRMVA
ncbi:MAG: DUF5688 family protein [Lachnospiraceae bacterium]|nr:DUF5688 family protein [Lachnospiraceae bacterium]